MRIFLIGFMGAGKSAIGRELAARLGYRHLDTDKLIEDLKGKSISQIFEDEGEAHFRELESRVLDHLSKHQNLIISTGGGMPMQGNNWERISALGRTVFLDADLDEIKERVARKNTRPLLQTTDPMQTLLALYQERRPLYERAEVQVQTKGLAKAEVVDLIIRAL